MTERGASASYRGYRLQALYTLARLLAPSSQGTLEFRPEGNEDLDIAENDVIKEAIQVKSYNGLVLSDLESKEEENHFFRRALKLINLDKNTSIKLVNFGPFGPQIASAWNEDEDNEKRSRKGQITRKLKEKQYSDEDIENIFAHIELIELSEDEVKQEVFSYLQKQLTGIDPVSAFDLLNYWLYIQAENRRAISYSDLIAKIQSVGRFINEKRTHNDEWFTSIQPIEDYSISEDKIDSLRNEFFRGISTRYEHILAELDFPRTEKIEEISDGFRKKNVVLIHAASGQGKSAIAYRYLHDAYPDHWRFSVKIIENRQHALSIAAALASHANAIQAPMIVFIDVTPGDIGWPELVKQLSYHEYLKILVVVREDDLKRANISDVFDYIPVDLSFEKDEARIIYERAKYSGQPLSQLTFDDTWHNFGGNGPLLEFVYLLTQSETLQKRLEGQVNRIRDEVREKRLSPDELRFLRLVSVGTAYDVRIHISKLIKILNLPEPSRTIQYFEDEYFIRVLSDGTFISGLHPIRSKILSNLLTDSAVYPWIDSFKDVISLVEEYEWESFLLQSFIDHPNKFNEILELIMSLNPSSWAGLRGIIYILTWAGVKSYIEENDQPIKDAYELLGEGWYIGLDLNFAGDDVISTDDWWNDIKSLFPSERREKIEQIRQSQSPKNRVFQYAQQWFSSINSELKSPNNYIDWYFSPDVFYWSHRFNLEEKTMQWLSDDVLSIAEANLSLISFSKFAAGYYLLNKDAYLNWLTNNRKAIEKKLAEEYDIVALEEKDDTIRLHFLTYEEDNANKTQFPIHDRTMERVEILRQLFPQYMKYGSQGYGHQFNQLGIIHDSTTKTGIEKKSLIIQWSLRLNTIVQGLIRYDLRPNGWDDYLSAILGIREQIVSCMQPLPKGISKYFSRNEPINLLDIDIVQGGNWEECKKNVDSIPLLPKIAVDPWGIAPPENNPPQKNISLGKFENAQKLLPFSITGQIYKPYFESSRSYFTSISNYLEQAPHIMLTNFHAGKLMDDSPQKQMILDKLSEKGVKTDLARLSIFNFFEAKSALHEYQVQFRSLFAHRVDKDVLNNLEAKEQESLDKLWHFWYLFAHDPRTAFGNPAKQVPARFDNIKLTVLNNIDEAIKEFQDNEIKAFRLNNKYTWDDATSVWIRFDIVEPTTIYLKLQELISILKKMIGPVTSNDLAYYVLKDEFKYIVLIPTIRGKLVNSWIWALRTEFTILSDDPIEKKVWAYIPTQIPDQIALDLGLVSWEHTSISLANQFSNSVSRLQGVLTLISSINEMPNVTDAGYQRMVSFMNTRSKELSELLQLFIDSGKDMLNKFQNLSDEEKTNRVYLAAAINLLNEIYTKVFPSENFSTHEELNLEAIKQYSEKLQSILPQVEAIRLLWVTDTIENEF